MISRNWVRKLFEEAKQWVHEGIIDENHLVRIRERYSGRLEYGRLINTFATIGSVLVGMGILLFVASNWDKLDRVAKITIIFLAVAGFDAAAYYFHYIRKEYKGLSEGFFLIGAFAFGAGIWLIAQIYQIHYNFSAGMIFWMLGIIPVAFLYRSWTIVTLSSILLLLWLGSYNIYYFQRPAYGFFPLALIITLLIYTHKQKFSLFVVAASFFIWLSHFWLMDIMRIPQAFDHNTLMPHILLACLYIPFGVILYGIGMWHQNSARFGGFSFLYKFLGFLSIALPTYSLTFAHHYYKNFALVVPPATSLLIALLVVVATAIFYIMRRSLPDDTQVREARLVFGFFIMYLAATAVACLWPVAASAVYNISLLIQVIGFMYLGFLRRGEGIFRIAIAVFLLDILTRYFDIFWQIMPRSLLFIFGGIILIGGAIFADRKRKEIERRMAGGSNQ